MTSKIIITILLILFILPDQIQSIKTVTLNRNWEMSEILNQHKLKTLYVNDIVEVFCSYNSTTTTPAQILFILMKKNNQNLIPQQIIGIKCQTSYCSIKFPKITQQNQYFLKIRKQNVDSQTVTVIWGNLRVIVNGKNRINVQLIKKPNILSIQKHHRFKLNSAKEGVSFNFSNVDLEQSEILDNSFPLLLADGYQSKTYDVYFKKYYQDIRIFQFRFIKLISGYYWFILKGLPNVQPSDSIGWKYILSYQTQDYQCPFDQSYSDLDGIFLGCTRNTNLVNQDLCSQYDITGIRCIRCLSGYILNNGICLQEQCPSGQYKRYGFCYPYPIGCQNYTEFTKCTKCSTNYVLKNGTCERNPLVCPTRTYYDPIKYTCIPINVECKQFDPKTGSCLSCVSPLQKLLSGVCVNISCQARQYILNETCVNLTDNNCQFFDILGGKCKSCFAGYLFNPKNQCIKLSCPDRFVLNQYGNCIRVTDLCLTYTETGSCKVCIPTHILTPSGECLQIYKSTPCFGRQYLGLDNKCHQASPLCALYNNGECKQCIPGYFLSYAGICSNTLQCGPRQIISNGNCIDVSSLCGTWDQKGLCLTCISQAYSLFYGVCVLRTSCGNREWLGSNGICYAVSPKCKSFNPSTGQCTECYQNYNLLNGNCCANGQQLINGQCTIPINYNQFPTVNDGCRIRYPKLGCIQCYKYFKLDQDQLGYGVCTPF